MIKNILKYINNDDLEINILKGNIHILNYIRIRDISNNLISIKTKNIIVNINGKDLVIKKMDQKELFITGIIKEIDFDNER